VCFTIIASKKYANLEYLKAVLIWLYFHVVMEKLKLPVHAN